MTIEKFTEEEWELFEAFYADAVSHLADVALEDENDEQVSMNLARDLKKIHDKISQLAPNPLPKEKARRRRKYHECKKRGCIYADKDASPFIEKCAVCDGYYHFERE